MLINFQDLASAAKHKRVAVFLDYDGMQQRLYHRLGNSFTILSPGTLAPIVNDPDRAFMSDEVMPSVTIISDYPVLLVCDRIGVVFVLLGCSSHNHRCAIRFAALRSSSRLPSSAAGVGKRWRHLLS